MLKYLRFYNLKPKKKGFSLFLFKEIKFKFWASTFYKYSLWNPLGIQLMINFVNQVSQGILRYWSLTAEWHHKQLRIRKLVTIVFMTKCTTLEGLLYPHLNVAWTNLVHYFSIYLQDNPEALARLSDHLLFYSIISLFKIIRKKI